MRIATFGDLHLGPNIFSDRFQNDEEHLLRFDDHLRGSHDRIVLVGDIFQTDYGSRPGSRPEVLEAAMERYPRISNRWNSASCALIYGNHDAVIQERMRAAKEIFLNDNGSRIWLTHGHHFDPLISEGPIPFAFSWMMGQFRRMGRRSLADFLEGQFFTTCQQMARSLGSPMCAAQNALLLGQYDIVIMGHTHQPDCVRFGNGVYANSGACLPNQLGYISIDTLTKRVELREFQGNNRFRVVRSALATPSSICPHGLCWDG